MKRLGISLSSYSENSDNGDELNYTEVTDKHAGFCPELYSRMCEYNPETLICRKEVKDEIYRQIDMLSEKNQRFARLLLDECQPKTMAKLEGCTANAAAKRIFDIRKVLKAGLSEFAN